MGKLTIGFLGGCIHNQSGISRTDLYYSVLADLLSSVINKSELQISLGRYHSFDQLVRQSQNFINEKNPDLLFLFIRPFPLMPLHKPIIKYDKVNGKTSRAFHPGLLTRKPEWNKKLTANQQTEPIQITKRNFFALRDLNLALGILIGLHRWALKYLSLQIKHTRLLCERRNTELIIISPPQNPESLAGNIICKLTSEYLSRYCRNNFIGFVNINSFTQTYFEKDNIHFNVAGHKKLAELLHSEIIASKSLHNNFNLINTFVKD